MGTAGKVGSVLGTVLVFGALTKLTSRIEKVIKTKKKKKGGKK